jgi:hypothetical protein
MARTLFGWGVDAVATNDPRAIVRVLSSQSESSL